MGWGFMKGSWNFGSLRWVRSHIHQPVGIEPICKVKVSIQQKMRSSGSDETISCFNMNVKALLVDQNGQNEGKSQMLHLSFSLPLNVDEGILASVYKQSIEEGCGCLSSCLSLNIKVCLLTTAHYREKNESNCQGRETDKDTSVRWNWSSKMELFLCVFYPQSWVTSTIFYLGTYHYCLFIIIFSSLAYLPHFFY